MLYGTLMLMSFLPFMRFMSVSIMLMMHLFTFLMMLTLFSLLHLNWFLWLLLKIILLNLIISQSFNMRGMSLLPLTKLLIILLFGSNSFSLCNIILVIVHSLLLCLSKIKEIVFVTVEIGHVLFVHLQLSSVSLSVGDTSMSHVPVTCQRLMAGIVMT